MDIRWIRPEELPQLLALYRHLHPEGWLEDGPQAWQIWEAIENMPGYSIIVAEEGGELLSSCTLLLACQKIENIYIIYILYRRARKHKPFFHP